MRIILLAAVGAIIATAAFAQAPASRALFSREQAARGQKLFSAHCAACHSEYSAGLLMATRGKDQSLGSYYDFLSIWMPPQSSVRPSAQEYLDIMARLSAVNDPLTVGDKEALYADAGWRTARMPQPPVANVRADGTRIIPKTLPAMEWKAWRGDTRGLAYTPADQIDAANVKRLRVAWRWSGANFAASPEARNITTPLMVGGVLYATAGNARDVVAIDAATGETLWMWRPQEDPARLEAAPRKGAGRGVSYWSDGKSARIFTVTPGFNLAALDARTGRPVAGFGVDGVLDLMKGMRGLPKTGVPDVGSQSPPLVMGDVVVVGPAHALSFRPKIAANVKGDVRGFDARTGKLLWTFRTIPAKGDPGYETWAKGTAETTGNGGAWAPLSGDPETGAIFVPVEAGTSDLYGGARPGSNAHTSSLVSLDAKTGRIRWERQLVHHDIWDFDVPATPILADIPMAGGVKKVVLQITKQAFVFAFDRNSGEPLWPIEERPVPKSDVPGEETWPTQPYPTLPAPFDRQGLKDNLIDLTPAIKAAADEAVKGWRLTELYTPPSLKDAADGTHGMLRLPHSLGGGNWEGGAYDPETGLLYVGSMSQVQAVALTPQPAGSDIRYGFAGGRAPEVLGLPVVKPPWGRITAIDMKSGQHAWMIANADTPKEVRDNPALKGVELGRTGIPSRAGLLATKTLLFAGEGEGGSPVLRAHDKASGAILAEIPLPASQVGLPMSYVWGGKQYIVMAVGDGKSAAEIVALALP